jgi:hypothetical protein
MDRRLYCTVQSEPVVDIMLGEVPIVDLQFKKRRRNKLI